MMESSEANSPVSRTAVSVASDATSSNSTDNKMRKPLTNRNSFRSSANSFDATASNCNKDTAYNPSAPNNIKRVIIEVGTDEEIDPKEFGGCYQDVRMELNATGHNLTSVLINPRESLLEGLFDEFATEQSAPLDYQSPLAMQGSMGAASSSGNSSHDGKTSLFTLSSHSHHSSHHSNSYLSSHHSGNSIASAAALYTITAAEEAQLLRMIDRLQSVFQAYSAVLAFRRSSESSQHPRHHQQRATDNSGRSSNRNRSDTAQSDDSYDIADYKSRGDEAKNTDSKEQITSSRRQQQQQQQRAAAAAALGGEEHLRVCYRDVPELFFRPNFSLENQEIFTRTLSIKNSGSDSLQSSTSQQMNGDHMDNVDLGADSTQQIQQQQSMRKQQSLDKLSYFLDLVEVALLRQIWYRSPAFFRALDDIRALQHRVTDAIQQLVQARLKLQRADAHATQQSALIPQMNVRQRNSALLQDALLGMQRVVQGRSEVLALIEAEDYFSAMELLATTKAIFHSKELNLSAVSCMRQIGNQLDDLDNLVCEVMCNKFVSVAIQWDSNGGYADSDSGNGTNGSSKPPLMNKSRAADALAQADVDEFRLLDSTAAHSRTNNNSTGTGGSYSSQLSALSHLLHSLILTERTQSALNMYKARLLEAIRLIVRTCVMEYLSHFDPSLAFDDGADPFDGSSSGSSGSNNNETPFAQRVREMSEENFLSCLSMCYEHVLMSVRKAGVFHKFMHDHLSSADLMQPAATEARATIAAAATGSPLDEQQQAIQQQIISMSKACLTAACDLAQRSISQLLNLRKEKTAKLIPEKMKFLWEISSQFVQQLEGVGGSTAYVLRQALLSQTKSFLDYLHESCKGRLVVTLDNERWVQCDVSSERQMEMDRLSSGKAFLPHSNSNSNSNSSTSPATGEHSTKEGSNGVHKSLSLNALTSAASDGSDRTPDRIAAAAAAGGALNSASSTGKKARDKDTKSALVDGKEFKVVWSVLLLTEVVLIYLDIAFNFSPVTTDVINKIVELFRLFNGRARHLVLGAQAIQSAARLKSISAKHLAITGQSLGLIIALLPHIRAALLAQIPSKHQLLLMELDRISHDFVDHHGQIVAKFVSIVGDFVDGSALRLREFDWDRNSAIAQQQQQQCEYFEEVQRNVIALHRVLQATLPAAQVQDVFSRIFALLNRKIPAHFEEVMPGSQAGRQRILDEVTHLVAAFSRLKGIDASALTNTLEDTFRKRYIRQSLQSTS